MGLRERNRNGQTEGEGLMGGKGQLVSPFFQPGLPLLISSSLRWAFGCTEYWCVLPRLLY